ncbi:MAG: (2Fe-2S)-binding protein [Oscillospiraceae bacterium]|nr:MAG: (2Fe-2S)-binding protein [Oscillospiraceae bacterium]
MREDKSVDAPNYICYCDKVTEEDIREAIRGGASTVAEVIRVTGAMRHCDCKVKNPKGT